MDQIKNGDDSSDIDLSFPKSKEFTYARGEKCETALLTETDVGNAIPIHHREGNGGKHQHHNENTIKKSVRQRETYQPKDAPLFTLTPLTDLLKTAPVPCSRSLSPSMQRSTTLAPSTDDSITFLITSRTISAASWLPIQYTMKKKPQGSVEIISY